MEDPNIRSDPTSPLNQPPRGMMASALFSNRTLLATHNPGQARASVENVFFRHRLRTSGSGFNPINFIHRGAGLSSLTFNLISYGSDVEVSVDYIDRSHYVLVTPLNLKAVVHNHDTRSDLESGELIVLDPMRRFCFEMEAAHSHLAIGIPKQRLNAHLLQHYPHLAGQRIEFRSTPYSQKNIGSGLFDYLAYICREIDRPGTMTRHNAVASSIEDSFLTLLIATLLEAQDPSLLLDFGSHVPACVLRAEEFMEQNLSEEISSEDIVAVAGVPTRTLYHGFRKHRGVSPVHWLRLRRLRQARLDLLAAASTAVSVTDVAQLYQFSHVGRFSRAYFEEFGEYPSDTLRRL
ncbi:AraC family transcriptional regulator [Kineobactrum salinum]|uniref:AraC family transcriptional regulator n=1 Tax=Kineobactrum salinum TaxID=2708301 RepID=A0A6C0U7K7_9GAMM|nr:AraC family transcriptional regulator [Kineobactrum salinum]QIB67319.1 AraC family transcriptional regulator [Kineobactrum salinum]